MLSAKGRDSEVNKRLAMGADLYVTKPFRRASLIGKIKELLEQGRRECNREPIIGSIFRSETKSRDIRNYEHA